VPEKNLVAKPGTWSRALHDQWVCFALSEMESWLWSTELNTLDEALPAEQRVPAIVEQNSRLFRRSAKALDMALAETSFLVEDRFTVTDIIVGYTLVFGQEQKLLDGFAHILAYLDRLFEREHCTMPRY